MYLLKDYIFHRKSYKSPFSMDGKGDFIDWWVLKRRSDALAFLKRGRFYSGFIA